MLARARGNARYIASVYKTVDAWAGEFHPRLDELEKLGWDEIPERSQRLVEAHWHEQFRQAKAEQALQLGVPVSAMGCAPQHPDCEELTDDDAGLSYAAIVRVAILRTLDAVQAAAEENGGQDGAPIDEESARAVVGSQERHIDEVRAAVSELDALLPTGKTLPVLELPESTEPVACR